MRGKRIPIVPERERSLFIRNDFTVNYKQINKNSCILPQEVPVEMARRAAIKKVIVGRDPAFKPESTIHRSNNLSAPTSVMMAPTAHARVRTMRAGTILIWPLTKASTPSLIVKSGAGAEFSVSSLPLNPPHKNKLPKVGNTSSPPFLNWRKKNRRETRDAAIVPHNKATAK